MKAHSNTSNPPSAIRRILLITDEPIVARQVEASLKDVAAERFRLVHVDQRSSGLEYLAGGGIDAILLDLSLPDARGLGALARLQAQAPEVPILVIAKRVDEALAIQAIEQGAQDYLISGEMDGRLLVHAIQNAIRRHRQRVQREQRARQLRIREANVRHLITANTDGMMVIDSSGLVQFVNPAAEALLQREREELLGALVDVPVEMGGVREVLLTGPDGQERMVEVRGVETQWNGRVATLAVLRDITERTQAEAAEKALMQMKDDVLALVSHELRTPLSSIKGFLNLLRKGKVEDPAVQQEFLTRVVEDVDRLAAMVNNLLDASRMHTGQLELELEEVNVGELIEDTLASLQSLAEQKDIAISSVRPPTPLLVEADRQRLRQVLVNLVGNALKFSPPHSSIQVTGAITGEGLTVKVTDHGVGIPAEDLPKVFDRFYRGGSMEKRLAGGTGLGLYISKQIIEAHGGTIDVESKVARGSTFFFTLPVGRREAC